MQDEFAAAGLEVDILGVNGACCASGNESVSAGRDLPWLQETEGQPVWSEWGVAYRDVVIVDRNNIVVAVYNLTSHNLAEGQNYAELYGLFGSAAQP